MFQTMKPLVLATLTLTLHAQSSYANNLCVGIFDPEAQQRLVQQYTIKLTDPEVTTVVRDEMRNANVRRIEYSKLKLAYLKEDRVDSRWSVFAKSTQILDRAISVVLSIPWPPLFKVQLEALKKESYELRSIWRGLRQTNRDIRAEKSIINNLNKGKEDLQERNIEVPLDTPIAKQTAELAIARLRDSLLVPETI